MFYLVVQDVVKKQTVVIKDVQSRELAVRTHQKFYAETYRDPKFLLQLHEARDHEELFRRFPQYRDYQTR